MKRILINIYGLLPICLQNLVVSIYGIKLYCNRYTKTYRRYLKIYSNHSISSKKIEKWQNQQFLKLLYYTVAHSPFYKKLYRNIDISTIGGIEDIEKLPILTKEMLKENLNYIYTIPIKKGIRLYTGGTTGIPMMVLKRKKDLQKRMAYIDAFKNVYGFKNNKMRSARFFGKNIIPRNPKNHIFWRNNYISKQRLYSTYYMTEENLSYYVKNLNEFKPEAIDGFVTAIYMVAKYIYDRELKITFTPKAIFTTAETVMPFQRKMIETVFGCPLRDHYGSNEGAPIIIQCYCGKYHEALDTGIFEHIPTSEGTKLVVTSFDSYATPLIRYDIGDYIEVDEIMDCHCKCGYPVIKRIEGRTGDVLFTKSRGIVRLGQLSQMVSELPDYIQQIQFIQEDELLIRIKVVINPRKIHDSYYIQLLKTVKVYLGADMEYTIDTVMFIERENSGKYRFIIQRWKEKWNEITSS